MSGEMPGPSLLFMAGVLVALVLVSVLVLVVVLLLRRRPRETVEELEPDLSVDVGALPQHGPRRGGPQLEFYHVPVRLAVLVVAPVGRGGEVPGDLGLSATLDGLLPGLADVLGAHRPIVRRWPPQRSTQGFMQSFFARAALPGERGKGTPWCALAGKVETESQQLLLGMVLCAERPNSLGEVHVQHFGGWLDVLRVRRHA